MFIFGYTPISRFMHMVHSILSFPFSFSVWSSSAFAGGHVLRLPANEQTYIHETNSQKVARAMSYLHEKSICHGDLYAHNVLVDGETGAAVLCDFGASFFYPSDRHDSSVLEGTEVRAFGLMARDMACRSAGCEWILQVTEAERRGEMGRSGSAG